LCELCCTEGPLIINFVALSFNDNELCVDVGNSKLVRVGVQLCSWLVSTVESLFGSSGVCRRHGACGMTLVLTNEVQQRPLQLIIGWVTISGIPQPLSPWMGCLLWHLIADAL
jgi:hypothetical protein